MFGFLPKGTLVIYIVKERVYINNCFINFNIDKVGMDNQAQDQKDVGINYSWLVLDTVRRMRDAQAQGRLDEYYTQFEYGLQLLLPHIEIETRANIEEDFATLMEKIVAIKETEDNEQTKKKLIQEIRVDFADTHRYFIMEALPRASIYKVSEEGVIDFNRHQLNETTEIIRNSGGLASTIARVATKEELKAEPAL